MATWKQSSVCYEMMIVVLNVAGTVTVIVIVFVITIAILMLNIDTNTNSNCNRKKQHLNEYFGCW